MRNAYKICLESLKVSDHLEALFMDGRIILKYILARYGLRVWIGFIWLKIWTGDGLL
jgi:hypothetical protein